MRLAVVLCLLWAVALGGGGPGAQAEAARVSGRAYVRLADWAKANDLEARWLKREETVELSRRGSKLLLTVDSREARIDGVAVMLLFPVIQHNGTVMIAQQDAQATLQPILFPPKKGRWGRVRTICLDPGHGGKDPGNRVGSREEKTYTLLLAQELREQLTKAGWKVTLTRSTDTFLELPTRTELAKRRAADVFVSLHFNSTDSSAKEVRGAEVYCLTPAGAPSTNAQGEGGDADWCAGNRNNEKNEFLAYQIQKALTRSLSVEDRGVRRARFAVLRDAVMPAVLIEGGFMSHPVEGRKIFDAGYRRQMARAIAEGLEAYKRQVEGEGNPKAEVRGPKEGRDPKSESESP